MRSDNIASFIDPRFQKLAESAAPKTADK